MLSLFKHRDDPVLQSERLHLIRPTRKDAKTILSFYKENAKHLDPWDPLRPAGFYTEKYWNVWCRKAEHEHKAKTACRFLVKDKDVLVGLINFTNINRGAFQNTVLSYKLAASYQGQGYMLEALNMAIPYMFSRYHLHRIEANYMPRNIRSGALLKRLGFVEHGLSPAYLQINGIWEDHILTHRLNSEA